ncbi:AAA family ATPase [Tianweitania sp. BSSL-BM11]|uniref:AAA family ATPase n=1 Tax=Tianweitania aestuarii TaxID=2814886 RepID=A0ABS5RYS8_9HYPH|nr:ATP-binding protein [Tianweitania aestuarii]MBS9721471.1 AAA family ATPase [Tianweitania aestuarii]
MSVRLRKHLLYRLRHEARRRAVDRALERGLLATGEAAAASGEGEHQPSKRNKAEPQNDFTFGLAADDNDASSGGNADGLKRLTLGPVLLGKTRQETAIILQRSGLAFESGGFDPEALVTVAEISSTVRARAVPHADEVAVMLLIAGAVERIGLSDEAWRGCLRRRDWQATMLSPVDGFEARLIRMLKEGSFGQTIGVCSSSDLTVETTGLPSRFKQGRTVILFRGSEDNQYGITGVQDKVAFAARLAVPLLGLAEEAEHLPSRLCRAADLCLQTGPLTTVIVRDTFHEVLGSAPGDLPQRLPDAVAAALSIHDLAAAMRPGLEPQAVLTTLVRLAGQGDDAENRNGSTKGAQSAKGDASRSGGWRSGAWDKTTRRGGAISSGSEVIEPAALMTAGSASIDAGEPGLSMPPTVETLHGYNKASDWALDLKLDLALWQAGKLPWSQMSTRLLLSGPPGTGKTTFARALCNTLQVPLIATSVSTWLEPSHLGDVIKRMRMAFEEAESHAPAILFVDEIDGIGRRGQKNEYDDYWNSVVNKLLELMDGTTRSDGLIIVGATNHPDVIDPAIRRSGRLETHIEISLPDVDALVGILAHHLGNDCSTVIASRPQPRSEARHEEAGRPSAPPPSKTNPQQMEPGQC